MESDEDVTFHTLVTAFTDFLTVAIHTILYERAIYPQTSFLTARKYGYPVRQNRHPRVCQWVQDAVVAIESELLRSSVDRIALVILSPLQSPLERFVFEVARFPAIKPGETQIPLHRGELSAQSSLIDLQEQFRGAMSKLATCGGQLKALPKSCSFTIAIEIKNFREPPIENSQRFIPVQLKSKSSYGLSSSNPKEDRTGKLKAIPVCTVEISDLHLEMWIEAIEAKESGELASS